MQLAELPQGYARQLDSNGGVQAAGVWRLHKPNKPDKPDKPNIWVRHGIPRGVACRSVVGLGRRVTVG